MGLSNLSFSATNINAGNDADKPTATVGSLYLATDTNILYVCYENGVWVNAVMMPVISFEEFMGVEANTMQTLAEYTINYNGEYTLAYTPYSPGGGVGYLNYEITKNNSSVITSGSIDDYNTEVSVSNVELAAGDTIQFRSEGVSGSYNYEARCKNIRILKDIQNVATKV